MPKYYLNHLLQFVCFICSRIHYESFNFTYSNTVGYKSLFLYFSQLVFTSCHIKKNKLKEKNYSGFKYFFFYLDNNVALGLSF